MKKTSLILTTIALMIVSMAVVFAAPPAGPPNAIPNAIWCDGELFGVTITPQDVPNKGPFDVIYFFGNSGLDGHRSISDAKPGDKDYNGGRWEVTPVTFTAAGLAEFDEDNDDVVDYELVSDSELDDAVDAGYITIEDPVRHFVCPLHPQNEE